MEWQWPSILRAPEGEGGGGGTGSGGVAPASPVEATPSPPAGLEPFWDSKANTLKVDDLAKSYGELSALKADHDKRLAEVPPKPDDYKLVYELPSNLKLPEDLKIEIDEKDPAVGKLRTIAHERGWTQKDVSDLLALEAERTINRELAEREKHSTWIPEQKKLLGEKADDRIKAVEGNLRTVFKDKPELYEAMRIYASDAKTIEALETYIRHYNNGEIPAAQPEEVRRAQQPERAKRMFPNMN
jgi:hypothetical protein